MGQESMQDTSTKTVLDFVARECGALAKTNVSIFGYCFYSLSKISELGRNSVSLLWHHVTPAYFVKLITSKTMEWFKC